VYLSSIASKLQWKIALKLAVHIFSKCVYLSFFDLRGKWLKFFKVSFLIRTDPSTIHLFRKVCGHKWSPPHQMRSEVVMTSHLFWPVAHLRSSDGEVGLQPRKIATTWITSQLIDYLSRGAGFVSQFGIQLSWLRFTMLLLSRFTWMLVKLRDNATLSPVSVTPTALGFDPSLREVPVCDHEPRCGP